MRAIIKFKNFGPSSMSLIRDWLEEMVADNVSLFRYVASIEWEDECECDCVLESCKQEKCGIDCQLPHGCIGHCKGRRD